MYFRYIFWILILKLTMNSLYTTTNRHVQPTPCETSVMKVVMKNAMSVPLEPLGKQTRMFITS